MGESGGGSSSTSQMIPLSHTAFSWACDGPTPLGHTLFSWRAGVRVQEGSSAQTADHVDGDKSLSKGQRKVCGTSPLPLPPSHTKFSWTQQGTGAIPAGHTSFSWTGAQLILSHPAVSAARCWLLELDDNLLAEILGHLPVSSILSFASLSKRCKEVMSEEEEEGPAHVWDMLFERDYGLPKGADKGGGAPAVSIPSLEEGGTKRRYINTCRVHEMLQPEWVGPMASKHSSNVSARQGASCCNFQGKPVVYGGWTNGWNTIRNDVNILKTSEVQSSEGEVKKVLEWETLSCGGCSPPCTYGPVIVAAESKECGECLVVHGGVQFGGYAGPVCDLRVLKLIGTDSAGERRYEWVEPEQTTTLPHGLMGTPRGYHAAAYVPPKTGGGSIHGGGKVYTFGGFADEEALSAFECVEMQWDESRGQETWHWSPVMTSGPSPCARFGHSLTLIGRVLYLVGGCTGGHNHKQYGTEGDELNDIWMMNVDDEAPAWTSADLMWPPPFMTEGRYNLGRCHSTIALGTSLLVFGGGPSYALSNDLIRIDTKLLKSDASLTEWHQRARTRSPLSHSGPPRNYTRAREGWEEGPCRVIRIEGSSRPRPRQSGCMASLGGASEVVLYGGWAGGDELGDLWVLKLGGLDDKIYRYSTAERLPTDPRRENLRRAPHEATGTNAALRMRLIQLVAAMQASGDGGGAMHMMMHQAMTQLAHMEADEVDDDYRFSPYGWANDDDDDDDDQYYDDDDDDDDDEHESSAERGHAIGSPQGGRHNFEEGGSAQIGDVEGEVDGDDDEDDVNVDEL